ncbi:hypothetical protein Tco_0636008 [Tanacetum coccineum]
MSNTNNNLHTQTSNALHNAIMEASGKDRPPLLTPGNYVQWKSKIKRYIDTKPNNELVHYYLQNPPYKFKWTEKIVLVAKGLRKLAFVCIAVDMSRETGLYRKDTIGRTIDQLAGGKLRDLNAEESWALLEDIALYDNESWNDPRDFAQPVKAIALPQDVSSTSDRRLIELENQVQHLMEAHLAPTQPTQVNKVTTPCEICSGLHDTQYCMEDPEQAFVEYASSRTDEAGGKWYTFKPEQNNLEGLLSEFMASQDARLSKFKANFKRQQGTTLVLSARSYPTIDPQCSCHLSNSINAIKAHFKEATTSQTSLWQLEIENKPSQPEEPEPTLEDEFQDLHLNLPVLEV